MSALTLPVYAIRRHRIVQDGAGVVTLVGVSGCPLNCAYCLNPEGRDASAPTENMTAQALYDCLSVDDLYFQATGGGVTFGGGEPLQHAPFLREFISLVNGMWQVRVETSLNVKPENALIDADEFIVDIKDMHEDVYARYTGGRLERALENLRTLLDQAGPERIRVRVPLIEGYNDKDLQRESIERLRDMGVTRFDPFVYRVP